LESRGLKSITDKRKEQKVRRKADEKDLMIVRNGKKWQEMMNRGNKRMEEDEMVVR